MAGYKPWDIQDWLPGGRGDATGRYDANQDPMDKARRWDMMRQTGNPNVLNQLQGNAVVGGVGMNALNTMNLGRGRFGGMGFTPERANLFYNKPPSPPGGIWPAIKKYAGQQGISDWLDAGKTIYDIYKNETVTEPMLREQQRRAAEVWGVQKPMLEFNLASAQENRLLKKQNEVRLWNKLSRQDDEPERTIENWTPTTYA
jgi:hypothetical protein